MFLAVRCSSVATLNSRWNQTDRQPAVRHRRAVLLSLLQGIVHELEHSCITPVATCHTSVPDTSIHQPWVRRIVQFQLHLQVRQLLPRSLTWCSTASSRMVPQLSRYPRSLAYASVPIHPATTLHTVDLGFLTVLGSRLYQREAAV